MILVCSPAGTLSRPAHLYAEAFPPVGSGGSVHMGRIHLF